MHNKKILIGLLFIAFFSNDILAGGWSKSNYLVTPQQRNSETVDISQQLLQASNQEVKNIAQKFSGVITRNYKGLLDRMFMAKKDTAFLSILKLKSYNPTIFNYYLQEIIQTPTEKSKEFHRNLFKSLLQMGPQQIPEPILQCLLDEKKPELLQALITNMIARNNSRRIRRMDTNLGIQLIILSFQQNDLESLNLILEQEIETRNWTQGPLKINLLTYLSSNPQTRHDLLISRLKAYEAQLPSRSLEACKSGQDSDIPKEMADCINQLKSLANKPDLMYFNFELTKFLEQNLNTLKKIPHSEKINVSIFLIAKQALSAYKFLCQNCEFHIKTADDTTKLFQTMFQISDDAWGLKAKDFLVYFLSEDYPVNVKDIIDKNRLPIIADLLVCYQENIHDILQGKLFPDELLRELISRGFDVNQCPLNSHDTPLHLVISLADSINRSLAFDLLIQQPNLNTKAKNQMGDTPCIRAQRFGEHSMKNRLKQYEDSHSI